MRLTVEMSRRIEKGILTHCYQRTVDGGVLFYSITDHLVYFTSYCVHARKYGIKVLGLCQMPDHVHDSLVVRDMDNLAAFKRDQNAWFTKCQNGYCNIHGPLFRHPFGSALKTGAKKVRTNLIYVGNNPVERQIVEKAEQYRWNYVAYAHDDHPFSQRLVIRKCSSALRLAINEVRSQYGHDSPLNYQQLIRLFKPLDGVETQQLIDFIINTYNVIDYKSALDYFDGSYKQFLTALHSTTGSEHDIVERHVGRSDAHYAQISSLLISEYGLEDIHEFLRMDKRDLYTTLRSKTNVPVKQIMKYLRMRDWERPGNQ